MKYAIRINRLGDFSMQRSVLEANSLWGNLKTAWGKTFLVSSFIYNECLKKYTERAPLQIGTLVVSWSQEGYLMKSSYESWMVSINTYYHTLYSKLAFFVRKLLEKPMELYCFSKNRPALCCQGRYMVFRYHP